MSFQHAPHTVTMRWRLTHHDLPPVDCRPFSSVRVPPQSWHLNSAPHLDKARSVGLRGALHHTHELGSCGCRQGCFAFVLQSVPSMRFLPIIDDPIRVASCMQNMCFMLIYKLCLAFTGTRWFCSLADEQNILYTFFAEQQRSKKYAHLNQAYQPAKLPRLLVDCNLIKSFQATCSLI